MSLKRRPSSKDMPLTSQGPHGRNCHKGSTFPFGMLRGLLAHEETMTAGLNTKLNQSLDGRNLGGVRPRRPQNTTRGTCESRKTSVIDGYAADKLEASRGVTVRLPQRSHLDPCTLR